MGVVWSFYFVFFLCECLLFVGGGVGRWDGSFGVFLGCVVGVVGVCVCALWFIGCCLVLAFDTGCVVCFWYCVFCVFWNLVGGSA